MPVSDAHGLRHVDRMAANVRFRDLNRGRSESRISSGMEVGKSPASADPDTAVGVSQEGGRVAIVPDQAVLLIVVTPAHAIVEIHPAIAAVPDASVRVGAHE